MISRLHSRVPHLCREPLQFIVTTVTVVTLPISTGFLVTVLYREVYVLSHLSSQRKPFSMRFSERRDGRDACDDLLRGFSRRWRLCHPSEKVPSTIR